MLLLILVYLFLGVHSTTGNTYVEDDVGLQMIITCNRDGRPVYNYTDGDKPTAEQGSGSGSQHFYITETPILTSEKISVNEMETVTFSCRFGGQRDGISNVTWIKDGKVLDVSDKTKYLQSNEILKIANLNTLDEGNYQCGGPQNRHGDELSNVGTLSLISNDRTGYTRGLVVGMTFLGCLVGMMIASTIFLVVGKIRASTSNTKVPTNTSKRNNSQLEENYTEYRYEADPTSRIQVYDNVPTTDGSEESTYELVETKGN